MLMRVIVHRGCMDTVGESELRMLMRVIVHRGCMGTVGESELRMLMRVIVHRGCMGTVGESELDRTLTLAEKSLATQGSQTPGFSIRLSTDWAIPPSDFI